MFTKLFRFIIFFIIGALIIYVAVKPNQDNAQEQIKENPLAATSVKSESTYREKQQDPISNTATSGKTTKNTVQPPIHNTDSAKSVMPNSEEIGNRPTRLDHIFTTTPPYENEFVDAYRVSPGLAPKLFRAAGFREGDILKAINDIDISDASGFEKAKTELQRIDTLKFSVLRNGQPLTLYLDIPSDDLKIGR